MRPALAHGRDRLNGGRRPTQGLVARHHRAPDLRFTTGASPPHFIPAVPAERPSARPGASLSTT